jgi:hypothetical protein
MIHELFWHLSVLPCSSLLGGVKSGIDGRTNKLPVGTLNRYTLVDHSLESSELSILILVGIWCSTLW